MNRITYMYVKDFSVRLKIEQWKWMPLYRGIRDWHQSWCSGSIRWDRGTDHGDERTNHLTT